MPPEEITQVAVPTTQPTATTGADTLATPATTPGPDEPTMSHRELVEFRKELREAIKLFRTPPPPAPVAGQPPAPKTEPKPTPAADADLAQRLAALERQNALALAYADYGIKAGAARDAIESAARYMPAEALRGYVEQVAKLQPNANPSPVAAPSPTTAPATATPAAPSQRSDGGPPAAATPRVAPTSLRGMTAESYKSLPLEERKKLYQAATSNNNPWQRAAK